MIPSHQICIKEIMRLRNERRKLITALEIVIPQTNFKGLTPNNRRKARKIAREYGFIP